MQRNSNTPAELINHITTQYERLRAEGEDGYPKTLEIDVSAFPDKEGSVEFTQEYGGTNNSQHGFMFTRIAVLIHHAQVTGNDS